MISLSRKDLSHSLGKFIITAMGVGMLLGIVLIMIGVYRGMIIDAEILLDDIDADLWIVQQKSLGPFAQSSRIHEDIKYSVERFRGISSAEALTFQSLQLPKKPLPIRVTAVGYDPLGTIRPFRLSRLIAGRPISLEHYEMVVSDKTGFKVGDKIPLLRHIYRVVGVTHATVSNGGEPLVFVSLKDAQELQFSYSNERIHQDQARGLKSQNTNLVNTIVARVKDGYKTQLLAKSMSKALHKSIYTNAQEREILTQNLIKMASKQIGMFTVILVLVATIIIALIIYTMTLEKIKIIAIMKLIGLPNSLIIRMILEETLYLGILAFGFALLFSHTIYDKFPKRVVLENPDALKLFIIVFLASLLASMAGVHKVIKAKPSEAIGG